MTSPYCSAFRIPHSAFDSMRRVLIVSHVYLDPTRRGKLRAFAARDCDVTLGVPQRWTEAALGRSIETTWERQGGVEIFPIPARHHGDAATLVPVRALARPPHAPTGARRDRGQRRRRRARATRAPGSGGGGHPANRRRRPRRPRAHVSRGARDRVRGPLGRGEGTRYLAGGAGREPRRALASHGRRRGPGPRAAGAIHERATARRTRPLDGR